MNSRSARRVQQRRTRLFERLEDRRVMALGPQLLADINLQPDRLSSLPRHFTEFNGETYFVAGSYGNGSGSSVWKTDGTADGTQPVLDSAVFDGEYGATQGPLYEFNGKLLFRVTTKLETGLTRGVLWETDGTSAGTHPALELAGGSIGDEYLNVGGTLFFSGSTPELGGELWKWDGNSATPELVKDIWAGENGSGPRKMANVNGELFFIGYEGQSGRDLLFTSDGTADGTIKLLDVDSNSGTWRAGQLTNLNGQLIFSGPDPNGLWTSDGTPDGTQPLKQFSPSYGQIESITVIDDQAYLWVEDDTHRFSLWRTDGTAAGTQLVVATNNGTSGVDHSVVSLGDNIYFIGLNGNNANAGTLWKLDPTTHEVSEVVSSAAGYSKLTVFQDRLYFYGTDDLGGGLWTSDGTEAGTRALNHFIDPDSTINEGGAGELFAASNQIFMEATDNIHGHELWTSDGTGEGTRLLKDLIGETFSSNPTQPVVIGDTAYFFADDGIHGDELWKSDGTPEGTSLVKDIQPGQNPFGGFPIANLNGNLLFRMDSGLWRSDGTEEGTYEIRGVGVFSEVVIGDLLYFKSPVGSGNQGWELWRSDGTTEGTFLISDLRPGNTSSDIVNYVGFNGAVYFTANDGSGYELWKTNGEQGNVQQVSNFTTGGRMGAVQEFGGSLYFTRLIGGHQLQLWKTNGNWETASVVATIDSPSLNVVAQWLATDDRLYFFNNEAYVNGAWTNAELWTTNGTVAGTYMLRDEVSPAVTGFQENLRATLGDNVFFTADDGIHGVELWTSDGTVAGTHLVKDVRPGLRGSDPTTPLVAGNQLYYSAIGPAGRELWRTDGTEAGTQQVADLRYGNSFFQEGAVFGGSLLVPALGERYGFEMWKVDLNDLPQMEAGPQSSTFVENGGPVAVTPAAVVSDVDNPTFPRGSFSAEIAPANRDEGDVLVLRSYGNGATRLSVGASGELRFGGVLIGTWSHGRGNKSLHVSFNAAATLPAVQSVLRAVSFRNNRDDVVDSSRTVRYTFNDGDGPGLVTFAATVGVEGVNDAPVLDNTLNPKLNSTSEDAPAPIPTLVSTLLKGAVTDLDQEALRGIAVTAASNFYGTWQYTLDGGNSWVGMNQPTSSEALLLPGWARMRFLPAVNFNGTVRLFYRAWDQTEGSWGGTLDVGGNAAGGSKSVSAAGEAASLWVKPVNDAPAVDTTANPTLTPVWEDARSPAGTLVRDFAAAGISDVDANARKGIAVTSVDAKNGKWQFSLDGGKSWRDFGVANEESARLLAADSLTKVRFIPNKDFDGQVTLAFRAWDRTEGAAGQTLSTLTRSGGTGTFSSAAGLATLTMVPRNDRPVLSVGGAVGYVHNAAAVTLAPGASVEDVDSSDFDGGWLRVHIADGASRSNRLLIGGEFTIDDDDNVLLGRAIIGKRSSNGWGTNDLLIAFEPAATRVIVQQLARSITFRTVFGGAGTRLLQFSLADGDGGESGVVEKTVNVS